MLAHVAASCTSTFGTRYDSESPEVGPVRFLDSAVGVVHRQGVRATAERVDVRRHRAVGQPRRAGAELGQLRPHGAAVRESAPRARATLHGEPVLQPRHDRDIDALPVLGLLAEVLVGLRELVHLSDQRLAIRSIGLCTGRRSCSPHLREPRIARRSDDCTACSPRRQSPDCPRRTNCPTSCDCRSRSRRRAESLRAAHRSPSTSCTAACPTQ